MSEYISSHEREPDPLSAEIAELLGSLGEDFGFDPETIANIAELPFEEAFEEAYGLLKQAGLDADELLSGWIEGD